VPPCPPPTRCGPSRRRSPSRCRRPPASSARNCCAGRRGWPTTSAPPRPRSPPPTRRSTRRTGPSPTSSRTACRPAAKATEHGLTQMVVPALVKPEAMEGTGFLGAHAAEVYRVDADDLYLVGTSEVALAAYHTDEILDLSAGPRRYAGFSPCFRREAGSYGKDTRGVFRVHWFDKVEMFTFCRPEEAEAEHLRLLGWEKEFLAALELPFQVVDIAAGDLGSSAARKYDCEAWFPSQRRYRELTSTSNCTTFQARRLNVRYRDENGKPQVAATLHGTLCAVTRTIACLLEAHQRPDG